MKFAAMAPFVMRILSAGRGCGVLTEYSADRLDLRAWDPRIGPYSNLVLRSKIGSPDLSSEIFFKSSIEIDAAHVSAMLLNTAVSFQAYKETFFKCEEAFPTICTLSHIHQTTIFQSTLIRLDPLCSFGKRLSQWCSIAKYSHQMNSEMKTCTYSLYLERLDLRKRHGDIV